MDIHHDYDYAVDSSKGNITYASVTILAQEFLGSCKERLVTTAVVMAHCIAFLGNTAIDMTNCIVVLSILFRGISAATGGALCAMAYANTVGRDVPTILAMMLVVPRQVTTKEAMDLQNCEDTTNGDGNPTEQKAQQTQHTPNEHNEQRLQEMNKIFRKNCQQ